MWSAEKKSSGKRRGKVPSKTLANSRTGFVTTKSSFQWPDKLFRVSHYLRNNIFSGSPRAYEVVSKSFRTGHLQRKLQIVRLSAIRCSWIAISWVSLVSFAAITLCFASQRVFIVLVSYFFIDSVRKLLDTPSYVSHHTRSLLACWWHKLRSIATRTCWSLLAL
jgi:hypothetical protein